VNISETVGDIDLVQQRYTNRDLYMPYSSVSFQITLSDLVKYLMRRSTHTVCLRQLSFLF